MFVKKIARIFDNTVGILGTLGGCVFIASTAIVVYEVVMRYFLNRPSLWAGVYASYSLPFMTFLATAWVLKKEGHVKIDLVLSRISPRAQAMLNVVTSIIAAIVCGIIAWYSVKATVVAFQIGYKAPTELRTPMWILVSPLIVGFFLLCIQFLRRAYLNLESWRMPKGK